MFFHHATIRKYTLGLLTTFNNIEIQTLQSDDTLKSSMVPIVFSSREKAIAFSSQPNLGGNPGVLPRMSLVFESMQPNRTRALNKNIKINKNIAGSIIQYQNNSIPYDFNYSIILQARGMSEAAMITEQVASYFIPTYTLKINEIPIQDTPSSIVTELNGISFETEEYDEYSTNLVTVTFNLLLRGNIYPSIKESGLVENLQIYLSEQKEDKYSRKTLIEFDGSNVSKTNISEQITPVITDISSLGSGKFEVIFEDKDNKLSPSEFTYIWNITAGSGSVTTGTKIAQFTGSGAFTLQVQVIDIHGNQSNLFQKEFIV